jgi:uncharacterized SAM-binding protein YcdF (DUF218 family)
VGFILSKVGWMFLSPGNFMILLMLTGSYLAFSHREGLRNFGRALCFEVAFLLAFIAVFPVGDWMLMPLENHFKPATLDHVDGIVILGADENPRLSTARDQPTGRDSMSYFVHAMMLARQYPEAKVIFAGGPNFIIPRTHKIDEADIAQQVLLGLGLSPDRLILERTSRNTRENAVNAAAIVHPKPGQKWLLVTSAVHMTRAMGCFRQAGWNIYPSPTNYLTAGQLSSQIYFDLTDHLGAMVAATHEYYGLLVYWLAGYINSPWPE